MSVLKELFGPFQNDVWSELARQIGGTFHEGGFWKGDVVTANVGPWTVTLDTFVVSNGKTSSAFTRLRAPYVNTNHFYFAVSREGLLSPLARWLGFQDVVIGDPEFDQAFVIKANDEAMVKRLFANPKLRELLHAQPRVGFEVQRGGEGVFGPDLPAGVDQLRFVEGGVLKDLDRLKSLFDLFSVTLHQLCHIGAAYEDDPLLPPG